VERADTCRESCGHGLQHGEIICSEADGVQLEVGAPAADLVRLADNDALQFLLWSAGARWKLVARFAVREEEHISWHSRGGAAQDLPKLVEGWQIVAR